jgi:hypothetical protein
MKIYNGTGALFSGRMFLAMGALVVGLLGTASAEDNARFHGGFKVSSATFENYSTLPISMIDNYAVNGVNAC